MEEKQFLEILVKRYIGNELSQEELEVFFVLLRQGKLDEILDKSLNKEKDLLLKGSLGKGIGKKLWHSGSSAFRVAASLFIFLSVGTIGYFHKQNVYAFFGKEYLVTVQTQKGEKLVVKLSDGSTVWLNESSEIQYPSVFADSFRTVALVEGEAYFDIKRDETKPFSVEAAGTRTMVLGTAFNIRSYSYLHNVQVTVTRGKVAVEEPVSDHKISPPKILYPNEQANFDINTRKINKVLVNSANAVAWKEGKLLFDNERFADITTILENKFDVEISFADNSIKDYHISAEFIATDSLPHVLQLLSLANNLDFEMENNRIIISKRKRINTNQLPM